MESTRLFEEAIAAHPNHVTIMVQKYGQKVFIVPDFVHFSPKKEQLKNN
jgi:hypothetical protein